MMVYVVRPIGHFAPFLRDTSEQVAAWRGVRKFSRYPLSVATQKEHYRHDRWLAGSPSLHPLALNGPAINANHTPGGAGVTAVACRGRALRCARPLPSTGLR
jgi:hypothetical protein